jgi:hypothetical protein
MITALGTSWKHRLFLLLLLPFYLTYILAFILTFILIFYLASILTFYLSFYFLGSVRVRDCIRSSVFWPRKTSVLWILQQRRWPRFFSPPGSYLWVHTVHGSVLRERRVSHRPQNWCLGKTPTPPKKRESWIFWVDDVNGMCFSDLLTLDLLWFISIKDWCQKTPRRLHQTSIKPTSKKSVLDQTKTPIKQIYKRC